ncbi:MAG: hypothetical protein JOZ54_08975 [Acidobacteria bacterium]|nr:hypothetical protein [Acidobacteriota bacterium]
MRLKVHFLGICTYVWWEGISPRMVLVNAKNNTPIDGYDIGSHVPTLRIAANDILDLDPQRWPGTKATILEWELNGARLRIESEGPPFTRDPSVDRCMPSLAALHSDIGPPSKAAVEDGDPALSSCIFELTQGALSCGVLREDGAAFSMLRTETREQGQPRLSITSFRSGESRTITLRDGAEITIANLGAAEAPVDFFLHYMLAEKMPLKPEGPGRRDSSCRVNGPGPATWPPGFGSVDAGCSNSRYP